MIKKYVAMGLGALIALAPGRRDGPDLHREDPHGLAQDAIRAIAAIGRATPHARKKNDHAEAPKS